MPQRHTAESCSPHGEHLHPAAETEAAAPVPMKPRKYTVPETLFPITVKKRDREAYVEKALRYVLEHDLEL